LNAGIVAPKEENEKLAKMLKVPINDDGFFLEAHMKLRPVDFATDGVFLAGLAHAPKTIEESLSQADAAVSRAAIILSKDFIETPGTTASVNEFTCVGCGYCASVCAYNAIELVEKKVLGRVKIVAEVNPALCKGCGACASSCRSNSIDLKGFTNAEILNEVYALAWA
ncbi:heterodisulfide reductase, partial [bacterium]